jgi:hypothetical protein
LGCFISPAILVTTMAALEKAGTPLNPGIGMLLLATPLFGGIGTGVFLVRAFRKESGGGGGRYGGLYVAVCGLSVMACYFITVYGCSVTVGID